MITAIKALWALIPGKDLVYCAIILAVGSFAAVEWHKHNVHEQGIGAAKVVAADTKTADKAKTQIAAGTAAANTTETSNGKTFDATPPAKPLTVDVGRLCHRAAQPPAGGVMSQAGPSVTPGADHSAADSRDGSADDLLARLNAAIARGHAADAQIVYLQGRVLELEKQMENSP